MHTEIFFFFSFFKASLRPSNCFFLNLFLIISGYDAWCGVAHGCTRKLGMKICGKLAFLLYFPNKTMQKYQLSGRDQT